MRPPTLAVKWTKPKDRSQAMPTFDWTAWDAAIEKAVGKYRFNAFRLALTGLGAAHRNRPEWRGVRKINGVTEDNATVIESVADSTPQMLLGHRSVTYPGLITVYNLNGQVVASGHDHVGLSHLSRGIYIVQGRTGSHVETIKFTMGS